MLSSRQCLKMVVVNIFDELDFSLMPLLVYAMLFWVLNARVV